MNLGVLGIVSVFASHPSFPCVPSAVELESKAACDRLALEIERTSRTAQSKMVLLSKERTNSNTRNMNTRMLAIQLIQDHNRVDVYQLLHLSVRTIHENTTKLTSLKSIPSDKDLVSALSNIIFGAPRLALFEVEALANVFRRMYGDKFTVWTRKNTGGIVNERVVKKLTRPIEESLVNQYLKAITKPSTAAGKAKTPVAPANNTGRSTHIATVRKSTPALPPVPPKSSSHPNSSEQIQEFPSTLSVVSMSKLAPTLPIRIFRPNQRLEIAFDVRTKNPVYVMERLDGLARTKATIRHPFYEEEGLPPEYRSRLCSFIRSGYDRGHMAPAANFGAESVRDTFNLCNVSPQDQAMNRSTWVKLENWCRKVAERELQSPKAIDSQSVHIVTGPVWLPTIAPATTTTQSGQLHLFEYAAIGTGDSIVHVPTHFFKVMVVSDDKRRQIRKFACFLVPNLKQQTGASLEEYVVHWDRLEAITGLQFFPHLATSEWKVDARKVTASLISSRNVATTPRRRKPNEHAVVSLSTQLEHLRI